mmetsp:Transcript_5430/g.5081  ORF Transcript_5430/g.5081 Transcript_5430/m.5081 type:complete len:80 (+) Transcript_5430:386-625(+)
MNISSSSSLSTIFVSTAVGVMIGMLTSEYYSFKISPQEEEEEETRDLYDIALFCIKQRRSIFPKQYTGLKVPLNIINDM